jgi:hypothetical protein
MNSQPMAFTKQPFLLTSIDTKEKLLELYEMNLNNIKKLMTSDLDVDDWKTDGFDFLDGIYDFIVGDKNYKFTVVNDKLNGEFTIKNLKENKSELSVNFINNKKEGEYKEYSYNGILQTYIQYHNNKKHGIYLKFNSEGKPYLIYNCNNGEQVGFFYEDRNYYINMGCDGFKFSKKVINDIFSYTIGNNDTVTIRIKPENDYTYDDGYDTITEDLGDGVMTYKSIKRTTGKVHSINKVVNEELREVAKYHDNSDVIEFTLSYNGMIYHEKLFWKDGSLRYETKSNDLGDIVHSIYFID